jgi:acyl-CoA thioester hydrolase
VRPDWIDENGHLNLAHYVTLFDWATDALWPRIGLGDGFRASGRGTFAAETHTLYRAELVEGETVTIASHVLESDEKRLHVAHEMQRADDAVVCARQELMYLSVDLGTRRVAPWPEPIHAGLREAVSAHAGLPVPDWVGSRVAMPK